MTNYDIPGTLYYRDKLVEDGVGLGGLRVIGWAMVEGGGEGKEKEGREGYHWNLHVCSCLKKNLEES